MSPRISICLPTYNGAATIRRALDSLVNQTFKDFELLIRDDCSTDLTLAIINEFLVDPRVELNVGTETLGPHYNMRWLLERSRGEYFVWASQDDYWEPEFLEVLHRALENTN